MDRETYELITHMTKGNIHCPLCGNSKHFSLRTEYQDDGIREMVHCNVPGEYCTYREALDNML